MLFLLQVFRNWYYLLLILQVLYVIGGITYALTRLKVQIHTEVGISFYQAT